MTTQPLLCNHFSQHTEVGICKTQIGFIQFIISPMWNAILELFPEFAPLLKALGENKTRWQELAAAAEQQAAVAEDPGAAASN